MFCVKDLSVLNLDPMLQRIVTYIGEEFCLKEFCLKTITSAYRPNDPGVHGQMPVRGCDLRCRQVTTGNYVSDHINSKWEYDYDRPEMKVCVPHGEGFHYHLHIQVHPNTKQRS